jgi:hypothetical protein
VLGGVPVSVSGASSRYTSQPLSKLYARQPGTEHTRGIHGHAPGSAGRSDVLAEASLKSGRLLSQCDHAA